MLFEVKSGKKTFDASTSKEVKVDIKELAKDVKGLKIVSKEFAITAARKTDLLAVFMKQKIQEDDFSVVALGIQKQLVLAGSE